MHQKWIGLSGDASGVVNEMNMTAPPIVRETVGRDRLSSNSVSLDSVDDIDFQMPQATNAREGGEGEDITRPKKNLLKTPDNENDNAIPDNIDSPVLYLHQEGTNSMIEGHGEAK